MLPGGTVLTAAGEAILDLLRGVLTSDLDVVLIDLLYGPAPRHIISCWTHRTTKGIGMSHSSVAVSPIWCCPLSRPASVHDSQVYDSQVHDSQVCGASGLCRQH